MSDLDNATESRTGAEENAAAVSDQPGSPASAAGAPVGTAEGTPTETPPTDFSAALSDMLDMLQGGGPVVLLLVAMSVFATAIVIFKAAQFVMFAPGATNLRKVETLVRQGRLEDASSLARRSRTVERAALSTALEGRLRGEDPEVTRENAYREASRGLAILGSWLRPLEVTAGLAPLLGLFGTVLGMIEAFAALEAAGSNVDPAILSGGIWQALLTTAVGLAVAMPAVIFFNVFERRIERAERDVESAVSAILTAPPAPGRSRHSASGEGADPHGPRISVV